LQFSIGEGPIADVIRRVPVEGESADSDGAVVHLLLHVLGGMLSELDIYREDSLAVRRIPEAGDMKAVVF
jgi:hypothetical protein